jgi:DNA modification methylase
MAKIIDQAFGENWAFYNADCVFGMSNLSDSCINLSVYSPPFVQLYIYSDSIADMGNSSDDKQFFEGYKFVLKELYRITKMNGYQAIHCKDLMRYMNAHGYSGQSDFPGKIIKLAERCGWTFQRWITVWKNPVVEMQRTKTYGLLHKSFQERAEVVRQGAPDIVLILRKQADSGEFDENWPMPKLPESVIKRVQHIWSVRKRTLQQRYNKLEWLLDYYKVNSIANLDNELKDRLIETWKNPGEDKNQVKILNYRLGTYTSRFIEGMSKTLNPGRLCFVRCIPIPRFHEGEIAGYFDMMGEIIERFEAQGNFKFHTRIALADGSYLVGFRNWTDELKRNYKELNGQVLHNLTAPKIDRYEYQDNNGKLAHYDRNGVHHHDYVGNDPPRNWHDDGYYSILAWQKYASPVWFDLDGLPKNHADNWMDIEQTDVLNFKAAKDPEDQKHICPLQLGLIERLILEYTANGNTVISPFAGIGSEGYSAIKLDRKAILFELKSGYWKQGVKYLKENEKKSLQAEMDFGM